MKFRFLYLNFLCLGICISFTFSSCNKQNTNQIKSDSIEKEQVISMEKAHIVSYQNLTVEKFKEKTKDNPNAIVIDVRKPEEIKHGKIEGAIEINWYDNEFAEKILALDKEKEYYMYCRIGGRSAKAARYMIKNGFLHVFNLEEGFQAWNEGSL